LEGYLFGAERGQFVREQCCECGFRAGHARRGNRASEESEGAGGVESALEARDQRWVQSHSAASRASLSRHLEDERAEPLYLDLHRIAWIGIFGLDEASEKYECALLETQAS
jgi:hypothetical protein